MLKRLLKMVWEVVLSLHQIGFRTFGYLSDRSGVLEERRGREAEIVGEPVAPSGFPAGFCL